VLSLILDEAVADEHLDANPVTKAVRVKAEKPARSWLEPDELADLLDACTDRSRTPRGDGAGRVARIGGGIVAVTFRRPRRRSAQRRGAQDRGG
jgi:hypothetical protein